MSQTIALLPHVILRRSQDILDVPALLREARCPTAVLRDPWTVVTPAEFLRLFAALERAVCWPAFAIDIATRVTPEDLGILGYYWSAHALAGDCVRETLRTYNALGEPSPVGLAVTPTHAVLHWSGDAWRQEGGGAAGLFVAVLGYHLFRAALAPGLRPEAVRLASKDDAHAGAIAEHFTVAPHYGQPVSMLRYPGGFLTQANPMANPALARVLAPYVAQHLERAQETSLSLRVAARLRAEMLAPWSAARHGLEDMAQELDVTPRALQKRLHREGADFTALRDSARKEALPNLLLMPELTLDDIGHRLGFEDLSALHRATRRWYGYSPGRMRRLLTD